MTKYILSIEDEFVAGVDEVARGTFIGPVIAACVVLPQNFTNDKYKEIKDSKKLTPKKRSELAEYIKDICVTYGIGISSNKEIDDLNILNATMKAMHRAVDEAYQKKSFGKILIDGPYFNGYVPRGCDQDVIEHICIPKGDSNYLSIAAASIIAKDFHTKLIKDLVQKNQILKLYDIENNKGYGTAKHLAAIKQYGITEFHRKSFGICKLYNT